MVQALEYLLLPRMILGDREGYQLVQRQTVFPIDLHQFRGDSAKAKPLLDHLGGHAEPCANLFHAPAFADIEVLKSIELVGRIYVGAGDVLVQTDLGRIVLRVEITADSCSLADLYVEPLRLPTPFACSYEIAAGRRAVLQLRFDHEVLDHALDCYAGGQRLYSGFARRQSTDIARGLLQLVKRHEGFSAGYGLCPKGIGRCPYSFKTTRTPIWVGRERATGRPVVRAGQHP